MCREHDPRQVPATSHNLTQPLASLALDTCLLEMRPKCIRKPNIGWTKGPNLVNNSQIVRMLASRGQKRQCTQHRTATDLAFHNRQP